MQKGTFAVQMYDRNNFQPYQEEVKGLMSIHFGVYKNGNGGFTVIHLPTSTTVTKFNKQRDAKRLINALETEDFPVSWEQGHTEALQKNRDKAIYFIGKIKGARI